MNKKQTLLFCLLLPLVLLSSISCQWTKKQETENLIDINKMAAILADLYLAEHYSQHLHQTDSLFPNLRKNKDSLAAYYHDIFAHHDILLDAFVHDIEKIRTQPVMADSMYRLTLEILERQKKDLETVGDSTSIGVGDVETIKPFEFDTIMDKERQSLLSPQKAPEMGIEP